MRLINIETRRLEDFSPGSIPPYAILSHTWGPEHEELSFRDLCEGNLDKPGIGSRKFQGCCAKAEKDGLTYIWNDTCCIDKTSAVELGEAINSMFQWYEEAQVCYAYLSDVQGEDHDKLRESRWFKRGWTLQELLAPEDVQFFDNEWRCLGSKQDLSGLIHEATGISEAVLQGFIPIENASVAQRMSWAANRVTKKVEDAAYSLMGIFGVKMAMNYGEGATAFRRLQEEISKISRDDSLLAWDLSLDRQSTASLGLGDKKKGRILSRGVLAISPADFAGCGSIVSTQNSVAINLSSRPGRLEARAKLYEDPSGQMYAILGCHSSHDFDQRVAIPVNTLASGDSREYMRPWGCCAIFISNAELRAEDDALPTSIFIDIRCQNPSEARFNSQLTRVWLKGLRTMDLQLVEIHPDFSKDIKRADTVMVDLSDPDPHDIWVRLRQRGCEEPDFLLLLKPIPRKRQVVCHLMIILRDMSGPYDLGKASDLGASQAASNGNLHLHVSLVEERFGRESIFFVKMASLKDPPKDTTDATNSMRQRRLQASLRATLQSDITTLRREQDLDKEINMREEFLAHVKGKVEEIDSEIKTLEAKRQLLHRHVEFNLTSLTENQTQKELLDRESEKRAAEIESLRTTLVQLPPGIDLKRWYGELNTMAVNRLPAVNLWDEEETKSPASLALFRAVAHGRLAILNSLFMQDIDVNAATEGLWATPLAVAVVSKQINSVRALLEHGAEIGPGGVSDLHPLLLAAQVGDEAILELILDSGDAESQVRSSQVRSAVLGRKVTVSVGKGDQYEPQDWEWKDALDWAAHQGNEACVELLLQKQIGDPTVALHYACSRGHLRVAQVLVEGGADVTKLVSGKTVLEVALKQGDAAVIEFLHASGAPLRNGSESPGSSSIYGALLQDVAQGGHTGAVSLLLREGADLNEMDMFGLTPLMTAIVKDQTEMAQTLLDHGADVNIQGENGFTALTLAASHGRAELVPMLLDAGADIEAVDPDNRTALMLAASRGEDAVVRTLLEYQADVDFVDLRSGQTALKMAITHGHIQAVFTLLSHMKEVERAAEGCTSGSGRVDSGQVSVEDLLKAFENHRDSTQSGYDEVSLGSSRIMLL